jgi:acetyltransferase-like isoleucine patch superfamily enzyme
MLIRRIREVLIETFDKIIPNRFIKRMYRNKNYKLRKGVLINSRSTIKAKKLIIGKFTCITGPIYIGKADLVKIGSFCAFGSNIQIIPFNHKTIYANISVKFQKKYKLPSLREDKGPIKIGNNVWVGDKVTFLAGADIGDGSIIGACSVINKKIPPFSIVVGSPPRIIRKRFQENIIEELLRIKWWDWTEKKIKRNQEFFRADLTKITPKELKSLIID